MSTKFDLSINIAWEAKNVEIVGSWDNFQRHLPLRPDPTRAGKWVGLFDFQGSIVQTGSRHWYYYIVDRVYAVHNPSCAFSVEPTSGQAMNILDPQTFAVTKVRQVAQGRSLSPHKILSPRPTKPNQMKNLISGKYTNNEEWVSQLGHINTGPDTNRCGSSNSNSSVITSISDSSAAPPLSYSSSSFRSSPVSSMMRCVCICKRYGITRSGDRIHLDCGGSICGDVSDIYSDDDDYFETCDEIVTPTSAHSVSVHIQDRFNPDPYGYATKSNMVSTKSRQASPLRFQQYPNSENYASRGR